MDGVLLVIDELGRGMAQLKQENARLRQENARLVAALAGVGHEGGGPGTPDDPGPGGQQGNELAP